MVTFSATGKSDSRVKRETKRSAHALTKKITAPKAKAGAHSTPYKTHRVRRETKRSAHTPTKKIPAPKAKAGAHSTPTK
ncbi:MAG: hypothetical protein AAAB16_07680, partial [Pseudomonas sp.]|uniref:hypothetical protein n=1 Tax=Pseudomonas sp. TaxID=306 RepID=UPI0030F18A8E